MPLFVAFAWISVLNYGFSLAASRLLSPGDFGLLAFAQALLLLGATILQSGVPWSLAQIVSRSTEDQRAPLVRGALVANVGLAAGLAALTGILYVAGPLRAGLEDPVIAAVVVVSLLLFAVVSIARAFAQGVAAFPVMATLQVTEVTFKAAAGLALIVAGFGAAGAVGGFAVGAAAAAVLGLGALARLGVRLPGPRQMPSGHVVGPMFGMLLGLALIFNLDFLAVKLLVTDRAVSGYYQAAVILASAPYFFVHSVVVPVLFSHLVRGTTLESTRAGTLGALRLAVTLLLPIEMCLIGAPAVALDLFFPNAYAAAAPVLSLMAIGNLALIVLTTVATAFQATDQTAVPARLILLTVAGEAALLFVVVPVGGAIAAVTSFVAATSIAATVLGIIYIRKARITALVSGSWLVRVCGAAAIGLVVLVAAKWATGLPIAGFVAGAVAYYLVAMMLGILERSRRSLFVPIGMR